MKRRRAIRDFERFPTPQVDEAAVLEDIRNRDYLSKFKEHHVRTAFYLALLGLTEEQMATVFDVSVGTLQTWKHKHPTFLDAVRRGKEQADAQVVYSLYQSAIGYEHDEEKIFMTREKEFGPDGKVVKERGKVVRVPTRKKYPPDVRAAIKWLEVRQATVWSAKQAGAPPVVFNQQNNFNLSEMSLEELQVLKKLGISTTPTTIEGSHATFTTTYEQQLEQDYKEEEEQ